MTRRRKYRSSRKRRAATAASRSWLEAAIIRACSAQQLEAADGAELTLLQRPQQLGLEFQRHIADFVEKQGAAAGQLELAGAALGRSGKGAAFMPKQLALQQSLRNCRAVDRHERGAPALAI